MPCQPNFQKDNQVSKLPKIAGGTYKHEVEKLRKFKMGSQNQNSKNDKSKTSKKHAPCESCKASSIKKTGKICKNLSRRRIHSDKFEVCSQIKSEPPMYSSINSARTKENNANLDFVKETLSASAEAVNRKLKK